MIQITDIVRGYKRTGDRKRALSHLFKRGYNYFVFFKDTQSDCALLYSKAEWVKSGQYHVS